MLRLYVENQTASEARIPIQWCVSKETIKKLENEKVVEPLLLLSITSDGKEVDRQVVPLDSVRTYVTFRKKGNHTLHGVIVWNNFDRNIRSYFLGKDSWGREYLRQVINVRGEFNDEWVRGVVRTFSHTSLDVNVSEEFFAKEPPKWLKKWVGCFYNNPIPVDQCGFRERVILSFSLLPIFLAIGSLLVAMDTLPIGLWFLLIGARGINWKLILSPWKMIMNQIPLRFIWDDFNGSIFIRGPDRWNPDNRHHPSIVCFTPVIPFSIFGFLFGINYLVGLVFPVTNLLLVSFAMVAGVSMIFFLATLLRKLIVEGANIPMREDVENELFQRGIMIVPDVIANSGGVISSYAEYMGMSNNQMFKLVEEKVVSITKEVMGKSVKEKINPRAVAMQIASERLEELRD